MVDPASAPPPELPGLVPGAVFGLLLGAVTLLPRPGRRTALRLLRPGRRDLAWAVVAGVAVAGPLYLDPDFDVVLLRHPLLHAPRWFLVHSRESLLASIALVAGAATWGSRVGLRARPRHARRVARVAGGCAAVGALALLALG